MRLPPLAERSNVVDASVAPMPGGSCSARSLMPVGRTRNRSRTSGMHLAEIERPSLSPERKTSNVDRCVRGSMSFPPLTDAVEPHCLERRCETSSHGSAKQIKLPAINDHDHQKSNLIPFLQGSENIPRPESRRPNSSFNLDGSDEPDGAARRNRALSGGQRQAFWKLLKQSMADSSPSNPNALPPTSKQDLPLELG